MVLLLCACMLTCALVGILRVILLLKTYELDRDAFERLVDGIEAEEYHSPQDRVRTERLVRTRQIVATLVWPVVALLLSIVAFVWYLVPTPADDRVLQRVVLFAAGAALVVVVVRLMFYVGRFKRLVARKRGPRRQRAGMTL